jgi:hypothetical protein
VIHRLIVVGASFGGFDALKILLASLPAAFPVPLAIVQHQSNPGSGLAALLQRYSALVVADAEDKDIIAPGVAYLAPPGYHLLAERGSLALSVDPPVQHARPSIDVLFEPATAKRAAMPEAALLSTPVDVILPVEQIGAWLVRLHEQGQYTPAPRHQTRDTPAPRHQTRDTPAPRHQTRDTLAPESSMTRI